MGYSDRLSKLSKKIRENIKESTGHEVNKVSVRIVDKNRIKVTIKDRSIPIEDIQEVVGSLAYVDYSWNI